MLLLNMISVKFSGLQLPTKVSDVLNIIIHSNISKYTFRVLIQ